MIKQFFSSLNIFYLKTFQYGKHLDDRKLSQIIDYINEELEWVKTAYDKELRLSELSVEEMLNDCVIKPSINHYKSSALIEAQLTNDLCNIHSISGKVKRA